MRVLGSCRLLLGIVALALPAGAMGAQFSLGDSVSVKDVVHTDPHRGTTLMKDATVVFEGLEYHESVVNQLLVQSHHEIEAKGRFVVITYSVENHADQVLDIWPLFFGGCSLVDKEGNRYSISKVSGQFAKAKDIDMQGKRMEPGEGMRSCIVFDIPEDAVPMQLTIDLIDARISLEQRR